MLGKICCKLLMILGRINLCFLLFFFRMNKKYVMWVFGVDSGMVVDMLEEEGKVSLFIYIFFNVCVEFVYFGYFVCM